MKRTTLQALCVIAGLSAGTYSTALLANETGPYIAGALDLRVAYDRLDVDLERNEIGPLAIGNFDSRADILPAGLKFTF